MDKVIIRRPTTIAKGAWMAPELGTAAVAEADLVKLAAIGIVIGAAIFLLAKHLLGTLARTMWLVGILAVGQVMVANNQVLFSVLETGKTILGGSNSEQFICELYAKKDKGEAANFLCDPGLKGTIGPSVQLTDKQLGHLD